MCHLWMQKKKAHCYILRHHHHHHQLTTTHPHLSSSTTTLSSLVVLLPAPPPLNLPFPASTMLPTHSALPYNVSLHKGWSITSVLKGNCKCFIINHQLCTVSFIFACLWCLPYLVIISYHAALSSTEGGRDRQAD